MSAPCPNSAAVRRLAYEAADSGLLNPELAAEIRRVRGVRRLGLPIGNWLTVSTGKGKSLRALLYADVVLGVAQAYTDDGISERSTEFPMEDPQ